MGTKINSPAMGYIPGAYKYDPKVIPGLDALTDKIKKATKGGNPAQDIPQAVQEFVSSYLANLSSKKK